MVYSLTNKVTQQTRLDVRVNDGLNSPKLLSAAMAMAKPLPMKYNLAHQAHAVHKRSKLNSRYQNIHIYPHKTHHFQPKLSDNQPQTSGHSENTHQTENPTTSDSKAPASTLPPSTNGTTFKHPKLTVLDESFYGETTPTTYVKSEERDELRKQAQAFFESQFDSSFEDFYLWYYKKLNDPELAPARGAFWHNTTHGHIEYRVNFTPFRVPFDKVEFFIHMNDVDNEIKHWRNPTTQKYHQGWKESVSA